MPPEVLARDLALAFAPLHKRHFGAAIGLAAGLVMFGLTAVVLLRRPDPAPDIGILAEYFYGYAVSWRGALVGFAWGGVTGFVMGWFIAFCRNLVIAVSLWITRTREELSATRDFLDHI